MSMEVLSICAFARIREPKNYEAIRAYKIRCYEGHRVQAVRLGKPQWCQECHAFGHRGDGVFVCIFCDDAICFPCCILDLYSDERGETMPPAMCSQWLFRSRASIMRAALVRWCWRINCNTYIHGLTPFTFVWYFALIFRQITNQRRVGSTIR